MADQLFIYLVKWSPVKREVFGSKEAALLKQQEENPGEHLHQPRLHVRDGQQLPSQLDKVDMVLLAELESIDVDISSKAGHPGDDTRSQLSEQDRLGQVLLDLLQPLTTF